MALRAVYRAGTEKGPSFSLCRMVDKVWLVTNQRLYFPLDQNLSPSTQRHGVKNPTSKVCLWTTDVTSLDENLTIKRKSDGICQVELKDSGSSEHAVKEVQARLRSTSHKWQKISIPQCSGGLSLMGVSTVTQAVVVYMKDHYPTTPEEFNFHAELKAACHWHWLDDTKQLPYVKPVPYDDCRLKIAATNTLLAWKEELKFLQEAENKRMDVERSDSSDDTVEEQLSDLRHGIYVLDKHFGSDLYDLEKHLAVTVALAVYIQGGISTSKPRLNVFVKDENDIVNKVFIGHRGVTATMSASSNLEAIPAVLFHIDSEENQESPDLLPSAEDIVNSDASPVGRFISYITRVPRSSIFLCPSVTPWKTVLPSVGYNNPGIRLFKYDRNSAQLKNIWQYFTNLTYANLMDKPDWLIEYKATEAFNIPNVSPQSLHSLVQTFQGQKSTNFDKYYLYNSVSAGGEHCDKYCKTAQICAITKIDFDGYDECLELSTKASSSAYDFESVVA
ncbi:uncharacterized protein [Montipora foliosa]|uniref:uncharacterized protein n=1 Tax=Montipora foliosa TaxID=591990 RepID=UPI0035F164AA